MSLKFTIESLDEVKEELQELYTEKDGKYVLDVEDMPEGKTEEDVKALDKSLRAERAAHKATKEKLRAFDEFGTPDELREKLDELDDMKTSGADGEEELLQFKKQVRTLTRERDDLKKQYDGQQGRLQELLKMEEQGKVRAKIKDIIDNLPSKYDRNKVRMMMEDEVDRFTIDDVGELAQYKGRDVKDWMINKADLYNLTVSSQPGGSQPSDGRKPEPKGDFISQMSGKFNG